MDGSLVSQHPNVAQSEFRKAVEIHGKEFFEPLIPVPLVNKNSCPSTLYVKRIRLGNL